MSEVGVLSGNIDNPADSAKSEQIEVAKRYYMPETATPEATAAIRKLMDHNSTVGWIGSGIIDREKELAVSMGVTENPKTKDNGRIIIYTHGIGDTPGGLGSTDAFGLVNRSVLSEVHDASVLAVGTPGFNDFRAGAIPEGLKNGLSREAYWSLWGGDFDGVGQVMAGATLRQIEDMRTRGKLGKDTTARIVLAGGSLGGSTISGMLPHLLRAQQEGVNIQVEGLVSIDGIGLSGGRNPFVLLGMATTAMKYIPEYMEHANHPLCTDPEVIAKRDSGEVKGSVVDMLPHSWYFFGYGNGVAKGRDVRGLTSTMREPGFAKLIKQNDLRLRLHSAENSSYQTYEGTLMAAIALRDVGYRVDGENIPGATHDVTLATKAYSEPIGEIYER